LKVAIVYWDSKNGDVKKFASALSKGVENQGHQVQIFDGLRDDLRLTAFNYIIMGTAPISLFSKKLEPAVINGIKRSGTVTGKRSFAFVRKKGLRSFKILQGLMKYMEAEGMMLKNSEIFKTPEEAEFLAEKLHIK